MSDKEIELTTPPLQPQYQPYKAKYDRIETENLKQIYMQLKKQVLEIVQQGKFLKQQFQELQGQIFQEKQELSVVRKERDRIIGETYLLKLNQPKQSAYQPLIENNRALQNSLVEIKFQNAIISQELQYVKDDLQYYQQVYQQKEEEVNSISDALLEIASQRDEARRVVYSRSSEKGVNVSSKIPTSKSSGKRFFNFRFD